MRHNVGPLVFMQLGFIMVGSILLCLAAGLFIDSRIGTSPWGTVAGVVVGTVAGFVGVYRLIARVMDEIGRDDGQG